MGLHRKEPENNTTPQVLRTALVIMAFMGLVAVGFVCFKLTFSSPSTPALADAPARTDGMSASPMSTAQTSSPTSSPAATAESVMRIRRPQAAPSGPRPSATPSPKPRPTPKPHHTASHVVKVPRTSTPNKPIEASPSPSESATYDPEYAPAAFATSQLAMKRHIDTTVTVGTGTINTAGVVLSVFVLGTMPVIIVATMIFVLRRARQPHTVRRGPTTRIGSPPGNNNTQPAVNGPNSVHVADSDIAPPVAPLAAQTLPDIPVRRDTLVWPPTLPEPAEPIFAATLRGFKGSGITIRRPASSATVRVLAQGGHPLAQEVFPDHPATTAGPGQVFPRYARPAPVHASQPVLAPNSANVTENVGVFPPFGSGASPDTVGTACYSGSSTPPLPYPALPQPAVEITKRLREFLGQINPGLQPSQV